MGDLSLKWSKVLLSVEKLDCLARLETGLRRTRTDCPGTHMQRNGEMKCTEDLLKNEMMDWVAGPLLFCRVYLAMLLVRLLAG